MKNNTYLLLDIYKDYINNIEGNSVYTVDSVTFADIQKEYYEALLHKIIYEAYVYKLPFRLGYFGIIKKKINFTSKSVNNVDWEATRKYGRYIRHINDHSSNFRYYFSWSKIKCGMMNKSLYRLIMSRTNKRLLAKAIKVDKVDFPEIKF